MADVDPGSQARPLGEREPKVPANLDRRELHILLSKKHFTTVDDIEKGMPVMVMLLPVGGDPVEMPGILQYIVMDEDFKVTTIEVSVELENGPRFTWHRPDNARGIPIENGLRDVWPVKDGVGGITTLVLGYHTREPAKPRPSKSIADILPIVQNRRPRGTPKD